MATFAAAADFMTFISGEREKKINGYKKLMRIAEGGRKKGGRGEEKTKILSKRDLLHLRAAKFPYYLFRERVGGRRRRRRRRVKLQRAILRVSAKKKFSNGA